MLHVKFNPWPFKKEGKKLFLALFCTVFVERTIDRNKYAKINFECQLFTLQTAQCNDGKFIFRQFIALFHNITNKQLCLGSVCSYLTITVFSLLFLTYDQLRDYFPFLTRRVAIFIKTKMKAAVLCFYRLEMFS